MLLEKHTQLWRKMEALEESATGRNRYINRGGCLLKEEKERNRLAKQIPQVEERLYELVQQYAERRGIPFLNFDITVQDYLAELHERRENVSSNFFYSVTY